MALIHCPECDKEISDKVKSCPHCGYPFENSNNKQKIANIVRSKKVIFGFLAVLFAVVVFFIGRNFSPQQNSQDKTLPTVASQKQSDSSVAAASKSEDSVAAVKPNSSSVSSSSSKKAEAEAVALEQSPDGKWKTKMYYMDAIVNGERKLWPMNCYSDSVTSFTSEKKRDVVNVVLDPNVYNPYTSVANKPYFSLSISQSDTANVTYTEKNFSVLDFKVENGQVIDLKKDGEMDLHAGDVISPNTIFSSFNKEQKSYFSNVSVKLDEFNLNTGAIKGYIKFKCEPKNGKTIDVEGYFIDRFKNNSDRPTKNDIYDQLNPKTSSSSGAAAKPSSSYSVTLPTLNSVPCSTCGGTGKITCRACNGIGYTETVGTRYGEYGVIVNPCRVCAGAGATICQTCGGSGSVLKATP